MKEDMRKTRGGVAMKREKQEWAGQGVKDHLDVLSVCCKTLGKFHNHAIMKRSAGSAACNCKFNTQGLDKWLKCLFFKLLISSNAYTMITFNCNTLQYMYLMDIYKRIKSQL